MFTREWGVRLDKLINGLFNRRSERKMSLLNLNAACTKIELVTAFVSISMEFCFRSISIRASMHPWMQVQCPNVHGAYQRCHQMQIKWNENANSCVTWAHWKISMVGKRRSRHCRFVGLHYLPRLQADGSLSVWMIWNLNHALGTPECLTLIKSHRRSSAHTFFTIDSEHAVDYYVPALQCACCHVLWATNRCNHK